MNDQGLVNEVISELYKRLQIKESSETKKRIITIGATGTEKYSVLENDYEIIPFQYGIEDYHALVIYTMSTDMLASLAVGCSHRHEDSFILDALFRNKPVYIMDSGWQYRTYKDIAPKALYNLFYEYEKRLLQYGIIPIANILAVKEQRKTNKANSETGFHSQVNLKQIEQPTSLNPIEIDLTNKKLVLESDLLQLSKKGLTSILISKGCIITPLAGDLIKKYNIHINRR